MIKQQKLKQGVGNQSALAKRLAEGGFILVLTFALFILLSLISYQKTDPVWASATVIVQNSGGRVGAWMAHGLYVVFGGLSYLLPLGIIQIAWLVLRDYQVLRHIESLGFALRMTGLLFFMLGMACFLGLNTAAPMYIGDYGQSGLLGYWVSEGLGRLLNPTGALLLSLAMTLAGLTWLTGLSWIALFEIIGEGTLYLTAFLMRWTGRGIWGAVSVYKAFKRPSTPSSRAVVYQRKPAVLPTTTTVSRIEKSVALKEKPLLEKITTEKVAEISRVPGGLPDVVLLDKGSSTHALGSGYTNEGLGMLSTQVEQHLLDFGIQANVVAVHPGPVITRFELQLAPGIKVGKLSALAKDLARSLSVPSVRVVEIIPGKTVVGIELPNPNRATVNLSEVLSSAAYQQAHSLLSLSLGVDIAGHPMVVDLAKMPHLLVAGTTGSGKSVGINAMILSLLFKASPEQVRLILIDPKMLELSVYDGIPHLLTPVVTDMKEAASALRWCVGEMERRYRLMAHFGVRNLAGFNARILEATANGESLFDPNVKGLSASETPPSLTTLPYVVVVIDELADMMMVVGKKVEQLIARIAQKARASGIHLILATQRPSVDVLTGLIKSNIPTRISYQVSSKIDSRTILDQQGAEQLLGHGDLLFVSPGAGAPLRVHGAFVGDKEVHRVAEDWRARGKPNYIESITQSSGDGFDGESEGEDTEGSDPLYDEAVEFVLQSRKASISSVQRRFKIGYNRAARLVEEMERTGLVGPMEGGMRDVLVPAGE